MESGGKGLERRCAACGSAFAVPYPSDRQRFCCVRCAARATHPATTPVRPCAGCGTFGRWPMSNTHCSYGCAMRHAARARLDQAPRAACSYCGTETVLPYSSHGRPTCSARCQERLGRCLKKGSVPRPRRPRPSYRDACAIVQACGVRSAAHYRAARRTDPRLGALPGKPDTFYAHAGTWVSWADFLGQPLRRTRAALLAIIRGILPVLDNLSPCELYAILRERGVLQTHAGRRFCVQAIAALKALSRADDSDAAVRALVEYLATAQQQAPSADAGLEACMPDAVPADGAEGPAAAGTAGAVLDAAQSALSALAQPRPDVVDFLVAEAVRKLWDLAFNKEHVGAALDDLAVCKGGTYAAEVRRRFLDQWNGAAQIRPPAGYALRVNARQVAPNLMQRLLAYRLLTERRVGNWSAPGAGKTLGAIVASRVVESRLTVVVAANNTLDRWEQEIRAAWPDSVVLTKERGAITIEPSAHTYLLLNYEAFQQPASGSMVERLAAEHEINMLVLDEIHNVKQRGPGETKRRRLLAGLLERAGARNPGLYVLGMSATPVINGLDEGASLLALILGAMQDDLETTPTVSNAIALHERLVIHGVRYRPDYRQDLREQTPTVDGTCLAPALEELPRGRVLPLEQALLEAKLDAIAAATRSGTVVYTHYVQGMVDPLRARLERAGLRVAEFTGRSKDGLELFKAGEVDVLIGSACLREGIDGLQKVSNRVIVASLPWTHAAYEQLLGRFWRQGSAFEREGVDVIIPQIVVGCGDDAWSWDRERMARVRYKQTLADAALDGVIPEGVLESERAMLQRSMHALHDWIARLERDDPAA